MASKGILYIVISGSDAYQRALEGLRMAEYQAGAGVHGVALMLQGEGVEWLRQGDEEYRKEIQTSIGVVHELGSPVFVCGVSLNDRGLTATMNDYNFLNSSAPQRISQVVSKGWQVAVF
ncbi:MAG: DsrE family protein [Candidatus Thermoplasmatota archaeon]|nr:DsrE family protein [Candidatus Thermoplasmatota archaeon]